MKTQAARQVTLTNLFLFAVLITPNQWMLASTLPQEIGVTIVGELESLYDEEIEETKASELAEFYSHVIDPDGKQGIKVNPIGSNKLEFFFPNMTQEQTDLFWSQLSSGGKLSFPIIASRDMHADLFQLAKESAGNLEPFVVPSEDLDKDESPIRLGQWIAISRETDEPQIETESAAYRFAPDDHHIVRNSSSGELVDMRLFDFDGDWNQRGKAFADWCLAQGHPKVEILVCESAEDQSVDGRFLIRIQKGIDERGKPQVEFSMNDEGALRMLRLTSANEPREGLYSQLGIVLDKQLLSAPRINEPIRGQGVIQGNFSEADIDLMIRTLSLGRTRFRLKPQPVLVREVNAHDR